MSAADKLLSPGSVFFGADRCWQIINKGVSSITSDDFLGVFLSLHHGCQLMLNSNANLTNVLFLACKSCPSLLVHHPFLHHLSTVGFGELLMQLEVHEWVSLRQRRLVQHLERRFWKCYFCCNLGRISILSGRMIVNSLGDSRWCGWVIFLIIIFWPMLEISGKFTWGLGLSLWFSH